MGNLNLLSIISDFYKKCRIYGEPSMLIFQSGKNLTINVCFKNREISSIEIKINDGLFKYEWPTMEKIAEIENLLTNYGLDKLEFVGCNYGTSESNFWNMKFPKFPSI